MDMDNAAVFLGGTILYALACIIILIAIVIANNIIHKYWKSFGWKLTPAYWDHPTPQFMTKEEAEKIAPHLEAESKK